ncbi:MAG TPA: WD40 repeat domain-containing protein [Ktedonobacteraceae bacterium]|nr:WD40 repeat domain-containing protein [Ktedonobacteraceae bacterium]
MEQDMKALPGTTLLTYEHTNGWVNTLCWSPDGRYIASGGHDATVRIWEHTTGQTQHAMAV